MTESLIKDLRDSICGDVRADSMSIAAYSVDASIYEIAPLAIVLPAHVEDIATCLEIARHHKVPLIPRGAATGITGGCIGRGIILDTSKYLNRIDHIDYDKQYAVCEPGVVQKQLNDSLAAQDYRLGPDTSTGNRATLGGMLANNAAGARSLRYGQMSDHVQEVELMLYTGEQLRFGELSEDEWHSKCALDNREGLIYRELERIRTEQRLDIEQNYPKIPRRVSGYNLNELIKPGPLNSAKLIAGSEGTLGIATEIRVGICRRPQKCGLCLLYAHSLQHAFSLVPQVLPWKPLSLEMIDSHIVSAGRSVPLTAARTQWIQGDPVAILIVEFDAATDSELHQKVESFASFARTLPAAYSVQTLVHPSDMAHVWALREAGVGLLLSRRSYSRAIAFLEDFSVGPDMLGPFMEEFLQLLHSHGKQAGVYGHVGAGCMHVRPYINLRNPQELATMRALMEATSDLLLKYHGSLSGEHGDGIVRSWLNEKMFGPKLYDAFKRVKHAFDPLGGMNPGKIIATQALEENLRMSPEVTPLNIPTMYDFSKEGGFALAADLCNGNGMCRKREGLMCPSFQAYGDEFHSTRARAQGLRAILNGRLPADAFTGYDLHHVLEYCLECKGCKTECPSQVDMAKMKAEFLYHYQEKHGYSLRSKLFAHLATINRLASPFAAAFNRLNNSWLGRKALKWLGIAPQRPLPALTRKRFSQIHKPEKQKIVPNSVVLLIDTYTEFNHPEIGFAALKVLQSLGHHVICPAWHCCGRPLISKGFLKQAKESADLLVKSLLPYTTLGLPVIGLEPSCLFTLKDDYPDLAQSEAAKLISQNACSFDAFLAEALEKGPSPWKERKDSPSQVRFHTHCHQKSLEGSDATRKILASLPHLHVEEIQSGCCGLAGSFGYEAEHYDFSMKIGETKLFPAVRALDDTVPIVANGMSCRSQIIHGTQRSPLHLAEFLALYI